MRRYTQKRFYEWSPAIAYSVGLMASDGCLSKDGRHVDLTSVDVEQLHNFLHAINKHAKIASKIWKGHKNKWQFAYRTQFSDVAYYDFLLKAGLTPNKSKTMPALNVPSQFYSHFLRGLFDGDGSCYAYFDKRWRSSYMFYIQFVSASLQFIKYIQSTNKILFGISPGSVQKGARAYLLSYAKEDSKILYDKLYEDSEEMFLTRKYVKLKKFIEQDRSVIMSRNARVVEW